MGVELSNSGPLRGHLARARRRRRLALLLAAACLHLSATLFVYTAGRLELAPGVVDTDGIVLAVASDGIDRLAEARSLATDLAGGDLRGWAAAGLPLHVKLYSASLALFGPLFGFNVVGLEPLNLCYSLIILSLVFRLCSEVFDDSAALVAAGVAALWPSLLLHTTQLLRDPLFISALLLLLLVCSSWLTRTHSRRGGVLAALMGGFAAAVLWVVRYDMWLVVVAVPIFGTLFFVARQLGERRVLAGNLIGVALLLALTAAVPRVVPAVVMPDALLPRSPEQAATGPVVADNNGDPRPSPRPAGLRGRLDGAAARAAELRHRFIRMYPDAGSNIDTEVRFAGFADVVRYLPRAAAVGFFAPFPPMWFAEGASVGRAGRLVGGLETALMYVLDCFAVAALWKRRDRLAPWLLVAVAAAGATALGLVVTNVGTLYRLRYAFWLILIVLGAEGINHFFTRAREGRGARGRVGTPATLLRVRRALPSVDSVK